MIPLKDDTPHYSAPLITLFLIAANLAVFLFQISLGHRAQAAFIDSFGLVPAHLWSGLGLGAAPLHGHLHAATESAWLALLPVVTSMFLHGGWWHIIMNMWFLWVFGRNVEEALGHFPYLLFYLTCGVLAALAQVLAGPTSQVPTVGASGAIAGIMGSYFVLYPRARVLMLVPFLFIFFLWLPAWVVLGYWFVLQFLSAVGTSLVAGGQDTGGVAFWAHIGGFAAGYYLVRLFPVRLRRYGYGYD
ncbi:MAG: rhomboid family intramembrane serine protease [Terracidiphilus sp.]|nr:rhomboid family intramembrane serine protease [Terracidiphilus sp.]